VENPDCVAVDYANIIGIDWGSECRVRRRQRNYESQQLDQAVHTFEFHRSLLRGHGHVVRRYCKGSPERGGFFCPGDADGPKERELTLVDNFINKLRIHPVMQTNASARRIDDLEVVLRHLSVSHNEHAIEMSDEIRGVIKRRYVSLEERIAMIRRILQAGPSIKPTNAHVE
jgi:hypothetical protein